MRVSRKFQKLFCLDAAQSLWEHACRWTHPVSARRILATIDRAELEKIRERYPYRPNARRINAYEDAAYWIGINVKHVQDLWLDRTPPLQILDLGCGAGYFLYLCRLFGHEGLGLDTDEDPFFRGTTKLLGVRRVIARITPQTRLPDLGKKFDLVSGHRVCFHRIARDKKGAHDFSSLMAGSCWNSIHGGMVLHFLLKNCARVSCRKARASFVEKRYSQRTQTNVRVLSRFESGERMRPRVLAIAPSRSRTFPCNAIANGTGVSARRGNVHASRSPIQSVESTISPDAAVLGQALPIVNHLRRRFARFKLCAHLLDLRGLLFELRCENLHPLLLLGNSGL